MSSKSRQKESLGLTNKKSVNFSEWYTEVIQAAEMVDYYEVSGCYILRPWSYSIWESIQNFFNKKITDSGVKNCYFPMFVTKSCLEKEKDHVEGFAPEVAWVTKSGGSDMKEPIAIRPTSETIMYPAFARWIRSHRDLPLRLNQWTNIVRWEFKHPTPFIRTREFLWQEGHTVFATKEEADKEVLEILDYYREIYEDLLAVPIIKGTKSKNEQFAGALYTTSCEAYVPTNGRAVQGATSHCLGQNFSKMFEISFEDLNGVQTIPYQNSWGISTRTIGVLIMVHGDDIGLILPPKVAPIQVIFVPIHKAKETPEEAKAIKDKCCELRDMLIAAGMRADIDFRDNYTAGWKYNHWEQKGVPLRIEIGGRDIQNRSTFSSRRDIPGKEGKQPISWDDFSQSVSRKLDDIQSNLFQRAKVDRDSHMDHITIWDEFIPSLNKRNLVRTPWCNEQECEEIVKKKTAQSIPDEPLSDGETVPALSGSAKTLCIPLVQDPLPEGCKCFHCGKDAQCYVIWGRSY